MIHRTSLHFRQLTRTVTWVRISSSLAADHLAVLYPDVDTPFTDATDVVKRLLPYHVFQHPKRDLDDVQSRRKPSSRKGKCKATEEDLLREEIAGMSQPDSVLLVVYVNTHGVVQKPNLL